MICGQLLRQSCIASLILTALLLAGSAAAQDIDFGNYHALLIANEKYEHWKPLRTPYEDVADLDEILRNRYGFKTKVIRDATRDDIIDELESLKARLSRYDSLLIYYAGHGKIRDDGGYWIGVDAGKNSRSRWLHYATISNLIDADAGMEARHVLVIADSCYSGAAMRAGRAVTARRPTEVHLEWLRRTVRKQARTILTSGGVEPVLDNVGTSRNSIFARELLSKLESNVEILDGHTLWTSIREDVHSRARRVVGSDAQSPEYGRIAGTGHDGGDFFFRPLDARITVPKTTVEKEPNFGIRGDEETAKTTVLPPPEVPARPTPVRPVIGTYIGKYKIGEKLRDCLNCPEMVVVPAGSFTMGSPKNEVGREVTEGPQHLIAIARPFAVGKYEVTSAQWAACVAHGGCREHSNVASSVPGSSKDNNSWQRRQRPVRDVSWEDAQSYVAWLRERTGQPYRLLTEAEWEYVARAGSDSPYAFGDEISKSNANFGRNVGKTTKVGSYPANDWDVHDMHGNVWEWVEDCWNNNYREAPPADGSAWGTGQCQLRVIRGGSWVNHALRLRSANRNKQFIGFRSATLGFRVAKTLP